MNQEKHDIFVPIAEDIICFHNTSQMNQIDTPLPYHHHDAYEIYLFLGGNTYMYLEHFCYHLEPGDLIMISPGEMHRSVCIDDQVYERIGINLKKTVMQKLSSRRSNLLTCFESRPFGENNLTRLSQDQMNEYTELADKLIACLHSDSYGQDLLAESYLTQLLVFINTIYNAPTCSSDNIMPALVSNIMTYVKEHLIEPISSEQLEQEFHYSGKYISEQFRRHTGLTIRAYIVDQRITLAKKHLSGGKTVTEACELSGFRDYANFIRSFKKIAGMPPGKFAKKSASSPDERLAR